MIKSFRSVWVCASVAAFIAVMLSAGVVFAAPPAQTPTGASDMGSMFDNPVVVVLGGVLLALLVSIGGGVVIALLATGVSRFFRRNLPTEEEMSELRAELGKPDQPRVRRRIRIGPTAEPFVLVGVGFVVCLILFSIALSITPKPVRGEEVAQAVEATPVASAGLPKSGDFGKITDGLPKGDPINGAKVFSSVGCVGCHSQKKDERLVGPSFYGLWDRAGTRVPGLSAKEYIYQSIVDPNTFVVPGFQPGIMTQNFASTLSPQQMADVLAWIEKVHSNEN